MKPYLFIMFMLYVSCVNVNEPYRLKAEMVEGDFYIAIIETEKEFVNEELNGLLEVFMSENIRKLRSYNTFYFEHKGSKYAVARWESEK